MHVYICSLPLLFWHGTNLQLLNFQIHELNTEPPHSNVYVQVYKNKKKQKKEKKNNNKDSINLKLNNIIYSAYALI